MPTLRNLASQVKCRCCEHYYQRKHIFITEIWPGGVCRDCLSTESAAHQLAADMRRAGWPHYGVTRHA